MSFLDRVEQLSLDQLESMLAHENDFGAGEYAALQAALADCRAKGERRPGITMPALVQCPKCDQWNNSTQQRCAWCEVRLPQWSPRAWLLGRLDDVTFRDLPPEEETLGDAVEDETICQYDAMLLHLWQQLQRDRTDVHDYMARLRLLDGREVTCYCERELYELLREGEFALATLQPIDSAGQYWLLLDFGDRFASEL